MAEDTKPTISGWVLERFTAFCGSGQGPVVVTPEALKPTSQSVVRAFTRSVELSPIPRLACLFKGSGKLRELKPE